MENHMDINSLLGKVLFFLFLISLLGVVLSFFALFADPFFGISSLISSILSAVFLWALVDFVETVYKIRVETSSSNRSLTVGKKSVSRKIDNLESEISELKKMLSALTNEETTGG